MTRSVPVRRPHEVAQSALPHSRARIAVALAVMAALIAVSVVWARLVDVYLAGGAPLYGGPHPQADALLIPAIAVAVAAVAIAPTLALRLPWRILLPATWLMATCWSFALAGAGGLHGITHGISTRGEYLPYVGRVHGIGTYLSTFTDHVYQPAPGQFAWSSHISGGPPGTLLIFALLNRAGLGGPVWAAVLVVIVGTAAAPAVMLSARCVAGETVARRAVPFLAFAPIAVWVATSADALFLGMSAWGIALLALAATTPAGWRSDLSAGGGGLLLGAALYCSYGILPLGAVAVAVVVCARRVRPLLVGALGIVAVGAVFAAFGFWWWDGLDVTRLRYAEGLAHKRPYDYFLIADLAACAISAGPAALAGLALLRRRCRLWWPIGGAVVAIVVSDVSGLSKGEVARIWLPFTVWLLLATAALRGARARRGWLAVQVALALAIQIIGVGHW
jgi:hypothetical protein